MEQQDKVGYVMESCTENGGTRSVLHGIFAHGAMAPTHYHTEFNESFEVLEGELAVWNDGKKIILKPGDKATIQKTVHHKFKNESGNTVKVLITAEPGYEPFEHNLKIMMGLQKDGLLEQLSKMTLKMIPIGIILADLSNTKLVGGVGVMFKVMSMFYSKEKIALRKKQLLERYCS
ncbi:MAG: cupin domain-containing protein [Bacteroidetes bacterium]|nr:cupin domain-containing protein [Bacteroidota bacterium]